MKLQTFIRLVSVVYGGRFLKARYVHSEALGKSLSFVPLSSENGYHYFETLNFLRAEFWLAWSMLRHFKFHALLNLWIILWCFYCSGTLEGKTENKSYKELIEDPQLKLSGLYQKYVRFILLGICCLKIGTNRKVLSYGSTPKFV